MFPYVGHEFITALMEWSAQELNRPLRHSSPKKHESIVTRLSALAFRACQMRGVKAMQLPIGSSPTRKSGAESHSPSDKLPLPGEIGMIKFTAFMRRRPELSHEQFVAHHREVHAPLFAKLPASRKYVRRYVQSHPIADEVPGLSCSTFDGITEIWFDDLAGFRSLFGDAEYLEIVRRDEECFVDIRNSELLLTVENPVITWQPEASLIPTTSRTPYSGAPEQW
jgi:uncharacterized protein (TIGR02118 family)